MFLSRTSVLSRLSASICDAVLAQSGSQRMLEILELSHLFLFPLDDERHWYRYHQLFAEVLLQRLSQREPDLIPLLQRRAAAWYADHDLPGEAVVYALAARDFDYALHLLECVAEATLLSGESGTVQGWLGALPDQLVRTHPYLSCLYAFLLLIRSQFTVVEERLQDAERAIRQSHASEEEAETRRWLGLIAVARSTVAINLGDAAVTITYAQRALHLLEKDDLALRGVVLHNLGEAYEECDELERAIQVYRQAIASNCKSGNFFVAVIALGSLARLLAQQGLVQEASETCRRALLLAPRQSDREDALLPSAGKPMLFLGKLLYEQNDLDGALTHTLKGIELSHIWMHQRHTIEGYLLLARVRRARGELTAAQEALQTAWRLVSEDNAGLIASEPRQKDEKLYAQVTKEIELIWKEFALSPDPSPPFLFPSDALGKREIEILLLLASGLSNQEIAEQLILTTGTVKWYTHVIYSKLRVRSRTQAIAEARRLHLLS